MLRPALLMALCCCSAALAQAPAPLPSPEEFGRRLREGIRLDYQLQRDFIYLERRRDVKISRLGKVTIGPLRTFEVRPSPVSGETYKRLIAVDGKPLSPEELARRDAEHEREVREAAAKTARETPEQRAERMAREATEQRDRQKILEDAFRAFTASVVRRETVDGHPVLVARMTPRPDARVTTREGRWMTHFEGFLWVAETDYQVVKLDMRATSDVTIGWGVIGRIHEGSRVAALRQRVGDAWLPAETTYEATGRTLIFRPFAFSVTTTYSDYKRRSGGQAD